MKILSVVFFAAIACTAVVFAQSHSLDDVIDVNSVGGIQSKIEDVLNLLKCGRVVVGDAIAESDLKEDFQQFAQQIDQIIKHELPSCRAAGNVEDIYTCLLTNGRKLSQYFYDFVKKVSEENKTIAEKIHADFQQKCMNKPGVSFIGGETFAISIAEVFQCIVNAIGEASRTNGLTNEWSKIQPKFQQHLDAWKLCSKAGGKLKTIFCNIKESVFVYGLTFKYIASISQNPNFSKFAQDFNKIAQQKCAGQAMYLDDDEETFEPMLEMLLAIPEVDIESIDEDVSKKPPQMPKGIWQRLKCTIKSISAAVKDTDFAKVWSDHMKEFRAIIARLKICQTKGIWERTKCTLKEYLNARQNLRNFLQKFKKARRESYKRMLKYIWKRCV